MFIFLKNFLYFFFVLFCFSLGFDLVFPNFFRVFGKIIRRGDHTHVSADSTDEGEYSVMLFVNEFWRKNYYGELYL